MKKNNLSWMTIAMMAFVCVGFFACGGGDDDDDVTNGQYNKVDPPSNGDSDPNVVDLGLSVKWASCNVGASKPEEFGGRYAWGETVEKNKYSEENYTLAKPVKAYEKDYSKQYTFYDYENIDIMATKYDVAYAKCGSKWRMPLQSECLELVTKCDVVETTKNGVKGFKYTGPNGNSIFIPFKDKMTDQCWTTDSRDVYYTNYICSVTRTPMNAYTFYGKNCGEYTFASKDLGLRVRPVMEY